VSLGADSEIKRNFHRIFTEASPDNYRDVGSTFLGNAPRSSYEVKKVENMKI
jgi:hypothetical protein